MAKTYTFKIVSVCEGGELGTGAGYYCGYENGESEVLNADRNK